METTTEHELPGGAEHGGRRARRRLHTRVSLLEAAHTLFASRGFEAVSVDDIADRADVAKGTFYNYFADKDTLAVEMYVATRVELTQHIDQLNVGVQDPAARMARSFCAVLRYAMTHRDRMLACMRVRHRTGAADERAEAGMREEVRRALASGRLRAPSEDVAMLFAQSLYQSTSWCAVDQAADVERLATGVGELMLVGLGVPRAEAQMLLQAAVAEVFAA